MRNYYYCRFCEHNLHHAPEDGKCTNCSRETEDRERAQRFAEDEPASSTEHEGPPNSPQISALPPHQLLSTDEHPSRPGSPEERPLLPSKCLEIEAANEEIPLVIPPHPSETRNPFNAQIWDEYRNFQLSLIQPWRAWTQRWTNPRIVEQYTQWFRGTIRDPMLREVSQSFDVEQAMSVTAELQIIFIELELGIDALCDGLYKVSLDCLNKVTVTYLPGVDVWKIIHNIDDIRRFTAKLFELYNRGLEEVWNRMMQPLPALYGQSIATQLLSSKWFENAIPEGLEETLPEMSPVELHIKRFVWPRRFERYLLEYHTTPRLFPNIRE